MGLLTFCRSVLKKEGGFERNNDGGKRMRQIGKGGVRFWSAF